MLTIYEKLDILKSNIKELESVAVAFSGGVDSTFLLKVAHDVLGDNAVAITARSSTYPKREFDEAWHFTTTNGIKHLIIYSEELEIEGFSDNPINRCYLCKKELFSKIITVAQENGLKHIIEGSNFDDNNDYRPGLVAVKEYNVVSPLRQALFTKDEIRALSKEMGLPTWSKQSFACLSSRFPYGEKITKEKLDMVDKAEQLLLDLKFGQVRVRHHGDVARIEISEAEMQKFLDREIRELIYKKFKEIGFTYVALDIKGYRTGSMNENINLV